MRRTVPSGAGLPSTWNRDHDQFICYCEALGNLTTKQIIIGLKQRFEELAQTPISEKAIDSRTWSLEFMDNDYFKEGSQKAIEWLEGAGIDVPKPDIEGISTHAAENASQTAAPRNDDTNQSSDKLSKAKGKSKLRAKAAGLSVFTGSGANSSSTGSDIPLSVLPTNSEKSLPDPFYNTGLPSAENARVRPARPAVEGLGHKRSKITISSAPSNPSLYGKSRHGGLSESKSGNFHTGSPRRRRHVEDPSTPGALSSRNEDTMADTMAAGSR
ncbi:MAG: hypothetical protein LQ351_008075 [Letrouitia transgressa]|nr:MAG: hypothetical protein LQ351_008075 [Letrouitia transgressa]